MVKTFANVEEWEWRDFVEAARIRVAYRDVAEHFLTIEKLPTAARQAWVAEQILETQPGRSYTLSDAARRKVQRAMKRVGSTVVGQILADHDARYSATWQWWASLAIESVELE